MIGNTNSNNFQYNIPSYFEETNNQLTSYWSWSWTELINQLSISVSTYDECQSFLAKYSAEKYWWCPFNEYVSFVGQTKDKWFENQIQFLIDNKSSLYSPENLINHSRRSFLPDIDDNLTKILKFIWKGNRIKFEHSTKSARGLYHGVSKRRSQYIGVLKGKAKWQVLINEGKIKKYIGTYPTELEAAIAHDFYSIGINGLNAKTNFNYNEVQVASMIQCYFESNKIFDPSIFASHMR